MRASWLHPQLAIVFAGMWCATVLAAQAPATRSAPPSRHARISAAHPAPPAEPVPPPPNWPINDTPTPASVRWDSTGLRIDASNSSLKQILAGVTSATGTRVEGFDQDQRVFGDFGPGKPREVLGQLLQGSGYNIIMIGDQGTGAPREIMLSGRKARDTSQPASRPMQDDSDDDAYDNSQIDTQPPQPPLAQPPGRPEGPGVVRTPQEIQQELQQRQQQLLIQQQQMQQQQQQTTNPPPN